MNIYFICYDGAIVNLSVQSFSYVVLHLCADAPHFNYPATRQTPCSDV